MRALIWDVDGTLAETERDGHRVAFNEAFDSLGLSWHWDVETYGRLLAVAGGFERLLFDFASRPDAPSSVVERERLARRLHAVKNAAYGRIAADGRLPLRDGVRELIDECAGAGIVQAIATTTSRSNVEALLVKQLGPAWRQVFAAVVCAEDAPRKKPDPQVYQLALNALGLPPGDVLAVEDSPAGASAALGASVRVVVTRSAYFADPPVPGALAVGPGFHTRSGWQPAWPDATRREARVDLAALRHCLSLAQPG